MTTPLTIPIAIDPAAEQAVKLTSQVNAKLSAIAATVNRRIAEHVSHYNNVWTNAALPVEQIVSQLGNRASAFFAYLDESAAHITRLISLTGVGSLDPKYAQHPRAVTANPDGTVTLGK